MGAHEEYIKSLKCRIDPEKRAIEDMGMLYFVFVVAGLIALYFGFTVIAVTLFMIGVWVLGVWLKEKVVSEIRTVVMNEQSSLVTFIKENGEEVGFRLLKEQRGR